MPQALYDSEQHLPGSLARLTGLAGDTLQPAIARATAVSRLAGYQSPSALSAAEAVLTDRSPLLALSGRDGARERRAGGSGAPAGAEVVRLDPGCAHRCRARAGGAGAAAAGFGEGARSARHCRNTSTSQMFNADRPESWTNLATVYAMRGDRARATDAFGRAIALDSSFVPAWVNLADFLRASGDEAGAGAALRDGLRHSPDNASLHYSLGLTLIRQRQLPGALAELKTAARLAPDDAHIGYVYGVALHDTGKPQDGMRQLEAVLKQHPDDPQVLQALSSYYREAGDVQRAMAASARLQELSAETGPLRARYSGS